MHFESFAQMRTIMVENIEKILERGDRIELLVDKTATMQDGAFHFRKQSKRLRRALWMKNAKLLLVISDLLGFGFTFTTTFDFDKLLQVDVYGMWEKDQSLQAGRGKQ